MRTIETALKAGRDAGLWRRRPQRSRSGKKLPNKYVYHALAWTLEQGFHFDSERYTRRNCGARPAEIAVRCNSSSVIVSEKPGSADPSQKQQAPAKATSATREAPDYSDYLNSFPINRDTQSYARSMRGMLEELEQDHRMTRGEKATAIAERIMEPELAGEVGEAAG